MASGRGLHNERMLRRGKILLTTLPVDPQSYSFTHEEPWIREVLVASAPHKEIIDMTPEEWAAQSKLQVSFEVAKLGAGEDYSFRGTLKADVPTVCSHCGTTLNVTREGEFQLYMKLVNRTKGGEVEDSGDADLVLLDHPDVDLAPLLSEQLIVLEPFAETPEEDSSGNPHICSKIPEIEAGQDPSFEAVSPFSKLAVLKGDN